MSLTKRDIIESVYEHIDRPKTECIDIVESFFHIIKSELEKGNDVMISGFGKWTVKEKNKRMGRNPQTGEDMTIDARKVITFKPSNVLRDKVSD